ncbi:rCG61889 [Rattus norvegicus]|uniref:RCG61889 n=1 Tax=Rattus norvegicus TaxID=10116 RepID=A6HC24_RAT|nr:rCG61889 [Rattus norvegicus]
MLQLHFNTTLLAFLFQAWPRRQGSHRKSGSHS